MKYNIGQTVLTSKSNKVKKISEIEYIEGVYVYYMEDKTSYSELQIKTLIENSENKKSDFFHKNFIQPVSNFISNIFTSKNRKELNKIEKKAYDCYSKILSSPEFEKGINDYFAMKRKERNDYYKSNPFK